MKSGFEEKQRMMLSKGCKSRMILMVSKDSKNAYKRTDKSWINRMSMFSPYMDIYWR